MSMVAPACADKACSRASKSDSALRRSMARRSPAAREKAFAWSLAIASAFSRPSRSARAISTFPRRALSSSLAALHADFVWSLAACFFSSSSAASLTRAFGCVQPLDPRRRHLGDLVRPTVPGLGGAGPERHRLSGLLIFDSYVSRPSRGRRCRVRRSSVAPSRFRGRSAPARSRERCSPRVAAPHLPSPPLPPPRRVSPRDRPVAGVRSAE